MEQNNEYDSQDSICFNGILPIIKIEDSPTPIKDNKTLVRQLSIKFASSVNELEPYQEMKASQVVQSTSQSIHVLLDDSNFQHSSGIEMVPEQLKVEPTPITRRMHKPLSVEL